MKAFVLTMRYTGLRIGDAIRLSRSQVLDGEVFVRTATLQRAAETTGGCTFFLRRLEDCGF